MDLRVKFPLLLLIAASLAMTPAQDTGAASPSAPRSETDVETSLLILGDAGVGQSPDDPVLRALADAVRLDPDRTSVLFLGDNVSPDGVPVDGHRRRASAERRLRAQVEAARGAQRVIFVPGNHDWAQAGTPRDWDAVGRQARLLAATGIAELRPAAGCPGPETLDVGEHLRLVFLDTEWWLHDLPRPDVSLSCPASTPADVIRELDAAVGGAAGRHVVIAGHHPSISAGPHGGRFDWMDHVFPFRRLRSWLWIPLPLAGSVYPLARQNGALIQDQSHRTYRRMVAALRGAIAPHRPLLFVAGHEHQLGLFTGASIGTRYVAVSGAGGTGHKRGAVGSPREALFASGRPGFMRIDFLRGGGVRLTAFTLTGRGAVRRAYERRLE